MSGIINLGFSIIIFAISYGLAFIFMPIIIGSFFTSVDPTMIHSNSSWLTMYQTNEDTVRYLVPLVPSFAIMIFVLKVIMTASARGAE